MQTHKEITELPDEPPISPVNIPPGGLNPDGTIFDPLDRPGFRGLRPELIRRGDKTYPLIFRNKNVPGVGLVVMFLPGGESLCIALAGSRVADEGLLTRGVDPHDSEIGRLLNYENFRRFTQDGKSTIPFGARHSSTIEYLFRCGTGHGAKGWSAEGLLLSEYLAGKGLTRSPALADRSSTRGKKRVLGARSMMELLSPAPAKKAKTKPNA